ncbi:hypothetical protein C2E31_06085 [Rhodopirellula baltica]|nr:hypothetical protein C2E31_06085 [Rhodopirellula baltica]
MLILKQPLPGDQEKRQTLIDQILSVIGDNERDPIEWLRAYVDDLRAGQFDAKRWQSVVDDQRRQVDMGINSDVTADSVLQLIKVIATRAIDEDARPSALSIVIDNLDLVSPSTHELANQTDWAISHELYPIVTELYDRHRHSFSMNAELLYSAAQAFRDSGNAEKGQRLAFDAFNINALPVVDEKQPKDDDKDSEDQRKLTDHQLEDIAFSHFSVAIQLEKRGQFDWEEREFRAIMANCDIETNVGVRARIKLASLFANQLRHEEAVQTLAVICDRIDRDKEYVRKLMIYEILSQFVQSEFYYQSALAILAKDALTDSEMTEAKENLRKAYVFDNRNVDILIRMFRFDDPSDPEWRRGVRERISQYVQNLDRTIVQYEASKSLARDDRYKELLGEKYNEYAWLVANTEGDLERALQCSLRSLSFVTADDVDRRAARLDTCARCYYALGQFEKAIATQKEALELERYSFPMLRQLAEFESALQAEKKENGS